MTTPAVDPDAPMMGIDAMVQKLRSGEGKGWIQQLANSENGVRMTKQMILARLYAVEFAHGDVGHLDKMLIYWMSNQLDGQDEIIERLNLTIGAKNAEIDRLKAQLAAYQGT